MSKNIVISGGTKGIGRAIVEQFAAQGNRILTCSRNEKELKELKLQLDSKYGKEVVFIYKADLSKPKEVAGFVEFVSSQVEKVDVLVNNTGMFIPGAIHDEAEGSLESMINTNLYSAYHLTRGLVKGMIDKKSGDIFNICSVASAKAYPNGGSYSISKFAMYGMSQGLREELKPFGIRVISVLPGATLTASWEGVDLPEERFIKAEDVALSVWNAHSLSRNTVIEDIVLRPQLGDI
ncbi:MAG: SDR family NAD(P)-dependent oxidoreductase [Reichenbachiella sp.]